MVPVDDSITIIRDRLLAGVDLEERTTLSAEEICRWTELYLKSIYFKHGEQFFRTERWHGNGLPIVTCLCEHLYGRF